MKQVASTKAYKGIGMEGFTAKWYASMTARGMEEFKALATRVAAELPGGGDVLEVAPGPGYFAIELAKLGDYCISGVDISHTMIEIARENAKQAGVDVDFRLGNASDMPFEGEAFDFVVCRAAFKNFTEPVRALQEMYRVLKPGGRALIIDLRKDASPENIREAVESMHLGLVSTMMTKLTFRFMLLKRAYTRAQFEELLSHTKFGGIEIAEGPIGFELSLKRSSQPSLVHPADDTIV